MPFDELQNIKALEDELRAAQMIEIGIKSNDGRKPIQNLINTYAAKSALYTNPEALQRMIYLLKISLAGYINQGYKEGSLLSAKAMDRFLEASERADFAQRQLRVLTGASNSQAKRRIAVAYEELNQTKGILKSDIKLFKMRGKLSGRSDKALLKELIISGRNKTGVAQGFAKRLKQITVEAIRRESSAGKIDNYLKVYPANQPWQWISISTKPCPGCQARAGRILTYNQWSRIGLPGTGRTICVFACRCDLMPLPIAEKRFPTVKTFNWKPSDMVIATSREIRTLEGAVSVRGKVVKKTIKQKLIKQPIIKRDLTPKGIIHEWTRGSKRKTPVIAKTAAIDEFGLPGVAFTNRKYNISQAEIGASRISLRAMYNETQKELKAAGISKITLRRGVKTQYNTSLAGAMESWTSDSTISKKFDGKYELIESITADRILTYHKSKLWKNGPYGEQYEYIVMPERKKK